MKKLVIVMIALFSMSAFANDGDHGAAPAADHGTTNTDSGHKKTEQKPKKKMKKKAH